MSPIYFKVDGSNNVVLNDNRTCDYLLLYEFPLRLPSDYRELVKNWIVSGEKFNKTGCNEAGNKCENYKIKQEAIISYARRQFRKYDGLSPGSREHIVGQLNSLCKMIDKEDEGVVAMEAIVQRGKKIFKPDVIGLNGKVKFVEVQSRGAVKRRKVSILKDLKRVNNSELIITIPKNEMCISNLVGSFKKYNLEEHVDYVWLSSPNLFGLMKGNLPKEYSAQEFLSEFGT